MQRSDVTEELRLGSRFGFMAYHGGTLEKATDNVAREAAVLAGGSYYGVVQEHDDPIHITSTDVRPERSQALATFLDHVDVVVSMHGYGRDHLFHSVLLGGRNRALARHLAAHARFVLPRYTFEHDLDQIPTELAGQHPHNPVNRPPQQGVQIELPPTIRWNYEQWGWSDNDGIGRAPQMDTLIAVLAGAARSWPEQAATIRPEPER
ncbi:MAG: poly-gamma-glutamate hydrolase family protein [Acidimicrobiales bacterium]